MNDTVALTFCFCWILIHLLDRFRYDSSFISLRFSDRSGLIFLIKLQLRNSHETLWEVFWWIITFQTIQNELSLSHCSLKASSIIYSKQYWLWYSDYGRRFKLALITFRTDIHLDICDRKSVSKYSHNWTDAMRVHPFEVLFTRIS